jgi:hypothetical protein
VNYDLPYNILEVEQRINRCHRQGQLNDVIVLSFIQKSSYGDVRTLEIANKRLSQYQGIIGMSDRIFGNFGADVTEVIRTNARHKDEIHREFAEVLSAHKTANEELVEQAESVLFTSFTSEVAKSVMVTPQYIAEKVEQVNTDLWEVVSVFLAERGYIIDETTRTASLPDECESTHLFYYWTGTRNAPYTGLRKYGTGKARVTLTSPIGRGVIHNIECSSEGSLTVASAIQPCKIGFYTVNVVGIEYTAFIGKAESGEVLNDSECREIMTLPVLEFAESGRKTTAWLRNSISGMNSHELDRLVPVDDYIQRQLESRTARNSQNAEISRLRDENNRKKADLERNLTAAREELKAAQSKSAENKHAELKLQREIALLTKKVKDMEKSLHYDRMKLEQQLQSEVAEYLGKSKLTARLYRQFVINIRGTD